MKHLRWGRPIVPALLLLGACAAGADAPAARQPSGLDGGSLPMTDGDRAAVTQALQQAGTLPIGRSVAWRDAATGMSGEVTMVREGFDQSGRRCREYHVLATAAGRQDHQTGFACLAPDGGWRPAR